MLLIRQLKTHKISLLKWDWKLPSFFYSLRQIITSDSETDGCKFILAHESSTRATGFYFLTYYAWCPPPTHTHTFFGGGVQNRLHKFGLPLWASFILQNNLCVQPCYPFTILLPMLQCRGDDTEGTILCILLVTWTHLPTCSCPFTPGQNLLKHKQSFAI